MAEKIMSAVYITTNGTDKKIVKNIKNKHKTSGHPPRLLELLAGEDEALSVWGGHMVMPAHISTLLFLFELLAGEGETLLVRKAHAVTSGHPPLSLSRLPVKIRRCWSGEGHVVMSGHSSPRAACRQR